MDAEIKEGLLPIGKMAKANRVTIAALRLYDQMDLLKPAHIDTESGYRYYDIRQSSRLDFIRYMRELGLSLSDIQDLLQREDIALIEEKLIEKNPEVILISDEVGYGVVPVDAFDREYREAVGRTCTRLASFSSRVTRVVCGVGTVIKESRSE